MPSHPTGLYIEDFGFQRMQFAIDGLNARPRRLVA